MLAVRTGPDAGRSYLLDERPRTLGRGSDCDLRWEDSALSRRHCRIRWEDGVYVLEDLDSSNGTYINGAVVRRAILRLGDRIQLGGLELEFTPPAARDLR
jgi:pSer/pThr/pTyr-binding forkhead associated (FHA) protein